MWYYYYTYTHTVLLLFSHPRVQSTASAASLWLCAVGFRPHSLCQALVVLHYETLHMELIHIVSRYRLLRVMKTDNSYVLLEISCRTIVGEIVI